MRIEEKVAALLILKKKSLAVAESCTGGLLCHRLTNIPGSSKFLQLGVVAYSNAAKMKLLNVHSKIISRHGAVSSQAAIALSRSIRSLFNADYGMGITGIAGPAGATSLKPLGLTFISVSTRLENLCLECRFRGNRTAIKSQAATQALKLLLEFLM